ncbi:hypothetical protein FACS189487_11280 [Campylobacterota bacterium]|nr:hypothetical protein FACS189487_11280 [Campylobacterota bacterium]
MAELNIATGLFKGYNDKEGIMVCGYEWGYSKADLERDSKNDSPPPQDSSENNAIFSKNPYPFARRIIKWFSLWGHPLSEKEDAFEKTIVQTNWCDTQAHHVEENYWDKLLATDQLANFLKHVKELQPRLILFFGSKQIEVLQDSRAIAPFQEIVGKIVAIDGQPLVIKQKEFNGTQFKVGFQNFERCKIVSLPHPSGSQGLSDDYIALFKDEISERIQEVKNLKHI